MHLKYAAAQVKPFDVTNSVALPLPQTSDGVACKTHDVPKTPKLTTHTTRPVEGRILGSGTFPNRTSPLNLNRGGGVQGEEASHLLWHTIPWPEGVQAGASQGMGTVRTRGSMCLGKRLVHITHAHDQGLRRRATQDPGENTRPRVQRIQQNGGRAPVSRCRSGPDRPTRALTTASFGCREARRGHRPGDSMRPQEAGTRAPGQAHPRSGPEMQCTMPRATATTPHIKPCYTALHPTTPHHGTSYCTARHRTTPHPPNAPLQCGRVLKDLHCPMASAAW